MTDGDPKNFMNQDEAPAAEAKRKARNKRKAAAKRKPAKSGAPALSHATLEDLARSGLDAKDAAIMGIEDMTAEQCEAEFGIPRRAYRLPYANFEGVLYDFYRARFTEFTGPKIVDGKPHDSKQLRYAQKSNSGVHLYLPRLTEWRAIIDEKLQAVIITEGEKKACAACKAGLPTVGLGGVDSFGSSKNDIDLLPELVILADGRRMPIVYDTDVITKDEVRLARKKLALRYFLAGGYPEFIDLPPGDDGAKIGLDDYLMTHSVADFNALPRQQVTPQLLVRWLHNKRKPDKFGFDPEKTARLIGHVVTEAMRRGGQFIKTDTTDPELLYFDRASAKIYELDEARGRKLCAFVEGSYDVNGADTAWRQVHEQTANHCMSHGIRVTVHKLSFYDRKTNTLYVAQSEGRLFKITRRGRTIVPNGTDHVFVRTGGRLQDVEPAPTGPRKAFDLVSHTASFKTDDVMTLRSATLLWEAWQLCVFFPQIMKTRPLVLLTGEPGSRKTSAGRAFGRSLMGSTFNVSSINKEKLDDLDAIIVGCPLVVMDNVDGTVPGIENRLAIVSTGGSLPKKKFYVTMQDVSLPYDAFAILTSFNPKSLTRSDLVDRELLLECERSDKGFKLESEVQAEIEDNRAQWWAFVLDHLSKVVAALGRPRAQALEEMRLADFAGFVRVVGPVLGYTAKEVMVALKAMVAAKAEFIAKMTSIPDVLATVVDDRFTELYHAYLADGKEGKEFKAKLAAVSARQLASELLEECRRRVQSFTMENPKAFGRLLVSERQGILTRIEMDAQDNKHHKAKDYAIAPQGGWMKALDDHIKTVKSKEGAKK